MTGRRKGELGARPKYAQICSYLCNPKKIGNMRSTYSSAGVQREDMLKMPKIYDVHFTFAF
jgi:hypothetical protein